MKRRKPKTGAKPKRVRGRISKPKPAKRTKRRDWRAIVLRRIRAKGGCWDMQVLLGKTPEQVWEYALVNARQWLILRVSPKLHYRYVDEAWGKTTAQRVKIARKLIPFAKCKKAFGL